MPLKRTLDFASSTVLRSSAAAAAMAADKVQTYTGVITETMCGAKHTMGISPDAKCVRDCVKMDPKKWKYALLVGNELYVLSDQQTPEGEQEELTSGPTRPAGITPAQQIAEGASHG